MKASKRSLLLLISFFAAGVAVIIACAGGEWDEREGSMFTPEIIDKPKYEPFFRASMYSLYTGGAFYESSITACNQVNINEWYNFFEKKVPGKTLDYWLYKAEIKQVDEMIFVCKGKKGQLNDSSKKYSLAAIQPAENVKAFLYYLGFAMRNEGFTCNDEYHQLSETEANIQPQITGGLKLLSLAKADFIKERYVFQLTRLYYFNKQMDSAITFFEKNKKVFVSGNSMKWRAMAYAAAANYKSGNFSEANYYYAQVYDNFDPYKESSYLSFHPQNDTDWEACLKLAKTPREKTVLWQLFGIYFDGVRAMEEIYEIDPSSDLLDLLLVRAVNIEEEKSGGPQIMAYNEKENKLFSGVIDTSLLLLVNKVAAENKTSNSSLWNLVAAHLNYSAGDFSKGDVFLKEAKKPGGKKELFNSQCLVISLFGKLNREKKLTEAVENKILPEIKILFDMDSLYKPRYREYGGGEPGNVFRSGYAVNWVRNTLAVIYARNGEFEKAEMIQHNTVAKNLENPVSLKRMVAYLGNSKKTALEKYFIKRMQLTANDYEEEIAIKYAQQDQLDSSLAAFKKMKGSDKSMDENPFNSRIKGCYTCGHYTKLEESYSSTTFIEKMLEIKNKAKSSKKEAAINYYLLACGYYNITYYGPNRSFYANNVSGATGEFSWAGAETAEYDCSNALKYYLLAAENSDNAEFKAKCMYMAAKCQSNPGPKNKEVGSDKYFDILKKDFSKTKYYSEIIKECSYFRTYLKK